MSKKVKELRGLIYSMYDSEAQMALSIGWTKQRLSKITNGQKEPDVSELYAIAGGLNQSVEKIANIFLHHKSPNEQLKRIS